MMKNSKLLTGLSSLAFLSLLALAPSSFAAGNCSLDSAYENNDRESRATAVSSGDSIAAVACNTGNFVDKDVYVLTLGSGDSLNLDLEVSPLQSYSMDSGQTAPALQLEVFEGTIDAANLLFDSTADETAPELNYAYSAASDTTLYVRVQPGNTRAFGVDLNYFLAFDAPIPSSELWLDAASYESGVFTWEIGTDAADLPLDANHQVVVQHWLYEVASGTHTYVGRRTPGNVSTVFMTEGASRSFSSRMTHADFVSATSFSTSDEGAEYQLIARLYVKDATGGDVTSYYDMDARWNSNYAVVDLVVENGELVMAE